jgi:chemotaxis methyl-accepting protein methylase
MPAASDITPDEGNTATAALDAALEAVLHIVRTRTGVDFGCYRVPMLHRRVSNRLVSLGTPSLTDYVSLLRSSATEPFQLLERLTIKVSRFYRHAPAFHHLRTVVLPALADARGGEPLRIWSAGCGAGEEPYTFAMLLEHLGLAGTVDATDIDFNAMERAREGVYPLSSAAELPASLLAEFLEPVVTRGQPQFRVQDNLRSRVRFARHDVTSDASAPGNGLFDLVSCRNVLIYLQRPAQERALCRLLDMIRPGGVLCLGEAEWPSPDLAARLEPLPQQTRLFRLRTPSHR